MSAPLPLGRTFPVACVVDASVLIKVFLQEPDSDLALTLLAPLGADPGIVRVVPDLLYAECASIFRRRVQRGMLTPDDAQHSMADLLALALSVFPIQDVAAAALGLAILHSISAYDAIYLALADALGIPLITADAALVRAVGGSASRIALLAGFGAP